MVAKLFYIDGATGLSEYGGDQWPYGTRFMYPAGDSYGRTSHILANQGRYYSDAIRGDVSSYDSPSWLTFRSLTEHYPWAQAGGWTQVSITGKLLTLPFEFERLSYFGSMWGMLSYFFQIQASGEITYRGLSTGIYYPIIPKQWFWFEYRLYGHTSNGVAEIRINETLVKRWTGILTATTYNYGDAPPVGEVPMNSVNFQIPDSQRWKYFNQKYDDLYVMFADTEGELNWFGKKTAEPLYVMGAGTDQECTPRGPSNFASVEFPVDDVLYVSAVADSEKDCYSYSNLETDRERNIVGLKVTARAKRNGVHTRKIRCYCRVSGTNYYGDTHYLCSDWREYIHIWAVNPNTGFAWTATEVNNAQYGFERVA